MTAYLHQPDLPPGTPPVQVALATIGDSLDNSDFFTCLPSNIVDALLDVARVAAADMANPDFCVCGKHAAPMAKALANLVDQALPI